MKLFTRLASVLAAVVLSLSAGAVSGDIIVTTPTGVFTNPGPTNSGDPIVGDTWLRTNVRNSGSVGITTDYARSGNGSMYFEGTLGPGGASSKADTEYLFSNAFTAPRTLGSLSSLGYDWYRDSVSTNSNLQHPVLRMYIDADGNINTTNDRGYLIYEQAYNGGGAVATDSWQSVSIGSATNLWWVQFGVGQDATFNRTLANWLAGLHTSGFATLGSSSVVYGLSSGVGSGWGPFKGAVDNISVAFGGPATTWNFETVQSTPVPLPGALFAGSALFAGLGLVRRLRGPAQVAD